MGTVLYRCFDRAGGLVYLGISDNVERRLKTHAAQSRWFLLVDRTERTPYRTRPEALIAERDAIRSEKPKFNIVHNLSRQKSNRGCTPVHAVDGFHDHLPSDPYLVDVIHRVEASRKRLAELMAKEKAVFVKLRALGFSAKMVEAELQTRAALGLS